MSPKATPKTKTAPKTGGKPSPHEASRGFGIVGKFVAPEAAK